LIALNLFGFRQTDSALTAAISVKLCFDYLFVLIIDAYQS